MPFFSVIIPLYNKENHILQTLNHVLEQSFSDFEIVIVDDGSTDNSLQLAENVKDRRIKIFRQQNQGAAAARNTAMKNASGQYFCFLDADDDWKPNHLAQLFETIKKFPVAGMYCARYQTKVSEHRVLKINFKDLPNGLTGYVKNFFENSLVYRVALTSAVCIPKRVFEEIGGFDEAISSGQDLDCWIRIALKNKVVITKEATVVYNNFLPKSLSKTEISQKKLPDLDKFKDEEMKNPSLKKFLDIYRVEYAVHHHISGNRNEAERLLKNVGQMDLKAKILLSLPPFILKKLLKLKRGLKRRGLDFTIYH